MEGCVQKMACFRLAKAMCRNISCYISRPLKAHDSNFASPEADYPLDCPSVLGLQSILPQGGRHKALIVFLQAFPEQKLVRVEVSEGKRQCSVRD